MLFAVCCLLFGWTNYPVGSHSREISVLKQNSQHRLYMKIISSVILIGGLVLYSVGCKSKTSSNKFEQQSVDTSKQATVDSNNNPYEGLRTMALSATQEQIGVNIPANETKIYGVIMDWDVGEGIATVVAFQSGDASVYLSSGGGVIGGYGHENVKTAAKRFVNEAQKYLANTKPTDITPLPGKDMVNFYFLTNKGKFVGQEAMVNFDNASSKWIALFNEANNLMSEIRITSDGE